jgi:hypothetical protein
MISRETTGIQAKATLGIGWLSERERLADVPEKEDLPFENHHHRALVTSECNDIWPMSPSSSLWLHHEKGPSYIHMARRRVNAGHMGPRTRARPGKDMHLQRCI